MRRRACLRGAAAATAGALAAPMAGCGFRLRTSATLAFERLAIQGLTPGSSMALEFRRQLGSRVQWVSASAQAQVVLAFETVQRDKLVTGLTSTGLVRELLLRLRVRFRLATGDGTSLLEGVEITLQRDLSTNESAALAKAREEEEIFRVLERDVVLQIIRRLEALPPQRLGA